MAAEVVVCIVMPPVADPEGAACTPSQIAWAEELRGLAQARDQSVSIFRTVPRLSQRRDETGRRIFLLDPWEADRLYKLIHQGCSAVFQAGQARVRLDPIGELASATSIPLSRLVQYKSYFAQFDGNTKPVELMAEFETWAGSRHINTHRDCRVLPLHMFAPNREWSRLMEVDGREEFERTHGKPSQLVDEDSRPWKQPTGLHGNDSLSVANHTLPTGFHWDVNAARTESRLSSLIERWVFPRNSYANVSPDGNVRGGQSSGISASREGTAPRPPEAEPSGTVKATRPKRRRSSRRR